MRVLLDFRTKPSYTPVIDLVNDLSRRYDVFLIPNKMSPPIGLNDNVILCRDIDVRNIRPDVIFSTYSTLLIISLLKAKFKSPVVNYMFIYMPLHDFFTKFLALPNSYKLGEMLNLVAFSLPKSSLMFDKLIVPNPMVEKCLINLGFPKDKIVVLAWGIDVDRYDPQRFPHSSHSSLMKYDEEDSIIYAGPLHPLRFHTQLLYAFSKVIKRHDNVRLLLLFRKDLWHQYTYNELINTINKLKLNKKVSIMISSSYEIYLSNVARASIVILPYFSSGIVEAPPFTLLECMALSKPVITSYGIMTHDIIHDGINGFIIPEDTSSLASLIDFLISNKEIAYRVGQRARMYVQEKYNLTNFSSKLSHLLESCCR